MTDPGIQKEVDMVLEDIRKHGILPDCIVVRISWAVEQWGYEKMKEWLKSGKLIPHYVDKEGFITWVEIKMEKNDE